MGVGFAVQFCLQHALPKLNITVSFNISRQNSKANSFALFYNLLLFFVLKKLCHQLAPASYKKNASASRYFISVGDLKNKFVTRSDVVRRAGRQAGGGGGASEINFQFTFHGTFALVATSKHQYLG